MEQFAVSGIETSDYLLFRFSVNEEWDIIEKVSPLLLAKFAGQKVSAYFLPPLHNDNDPMSERGYIGMKLDPMGRDCAKALTWLARLA